MSLSAPSLLLIEGPKFPSFNFQFTETPTCSTSDSESFTSVTDVEDGNVEIKDHAVCTAASVWDAGSGKSIPSLATAILGAKKVTTTDVPDIIPRIKRIVKLNGLEGSIDVKPLDWLNREIFLKSLTNENDPWDFIIGADIVWVDYLIQPLIKTIDALSTPLHTKLLLSHQTRTTKSDKMFFEGLEKLNWKVEKIARDELNWEEGFVKDGVEIYRGYKGPAEYDL
ncbi:15700_t:CDS:2 [Acaulospora colombiana]|uniref:15700_t:CDS:1 n=1 Tax=Acaulospora colombiana TaxID=27376 RepID=A0ACA9KK58_9GLOM|nr:15700_t:CDS:2 [Acaulospora colombiana]